MSTVAELSFERTLDRRLVHREAVSGVLLTSLCELSDTRWLSGFQLSRQHLGRYASPQVPLRLGAEVLRQSGLAIAHSHFDVPLDAAFLIDELALYWSVEADIHFPAFGPIAGECETTLISESKRRERTSDLTLKLELSTSNGKLAHGSGRLRCVSPSQYRALRRSSPSSLDVPGRTDTALLTDVTKTPAGVAAILSWDPTDAFYFDHPTDHVPGMVLIGAMTSAAELVLDGRMPIGFTASFLKFVEFEPDAFVFASISGESSQVDVEVRQNGVVVALGRWGS